MSVGIAIFILIGAVLSGAAAGHWLERHRRRSSRERSKPGVRVLFPFTTPHSPERDSAFESALRLAEAEGATIVAAFLERVPRQLPLEASPDGHPSRLPSMAAFERRATACGVRVDTRRTRGRTYRDALRRLLDQEVFDRLVVSAGDSLRVGLSGLDARWLLKHEVVILPSGHLENGGPDTSASPDFRARGELGPAP